MRSVLTNALLFLSLSGSVFMSLQDSAFAIPEAPQKPYHLWVRDPLTIARFFRNPEIVTQKLAPEQELDRDCVARWLTSDGHMDRLARRQVIQELRVKKPGEISAPLFRKVSEPPQSAGMASSAAPVEELEIYVRYSGRSLPGQSSDELLRCPLRAKLSQKN